MDPHGWTASIHHQSERHFIMTYYIDYRYFSSQSVYEGQGRMFRLIIVIHVIVWPVYNNYLFIKTSISFDMPILDAFNINRYLAWGKWCSPFCLSFIDVMSFSFSECLSGNFGTDCRYTCTGHCKHGTFCHHIDGWCPSGCQDGWQGPYCEDGELPRGMYFSVVGDLQ